MIILLYIRVYSIKQFLSEGGKNTITKNDEVFTECKFINAYKKETVVPTPDENKPTPDNNKPNDNENNNSGESNNSSNTTNSITTNKDKNQDVKTGDSTNIAGWVALMCGSALVMLRQIKKRKEENI